MSTTAIIIGYLGVAFFVLGCLPYTHEDDWRVSTRNTIVEIVFACAWPLIIATAVVACVVFAVQGCIVALREWKRVP